MAPGEIEAVLDVVVARSRLFSSLVEDLLGHEASLVLGIEDASAAIIIAFDRRWVVLAHTRVRLLEVDVHRDRLDVVQRVLLVEWQTEVSLELHLGACDVLFDRVRVILAWTHVDVGVGRQHIGILNKPFLLRCEVRVKDLSIEADLFDHS